MKPLNQKIRTQTFLKFLAISMTFLSLFGFSIYSYVFTDKNIEGTTEVNQIENKTFEQFLNDANTIVSNFKSADNDTDRSKYQLDLNKLISSKEGEFTTKRNSFDIVSEVYKDIFRVNEKVEKIEEDSEEICEEKIKELEDEIDELKNANEDLEDEVKDAGGDAKDVASVAKGLNISAGRISNILNDFVSKDICGLGKKRQDEAKTLLKSQLEEIQQQILLKASEL